MLAGQAQKEFFVNEAFARIDALLHPVIEGEADTPPVAPQPGECWVVGDPASGGWAGHEEALVSWDGEQWSFCLPVEGMLLYDRSTGARLTFRGGWQRLAQPSPPVGGTVIDEEARAAIASLVDMLATLAFFPHN